jgi:hypothetical protein
VRGLRPQVASIGLLFWQVPLVDPTVITFSCRCRRIR